MLISQTDIDTFKEELESYYIAYYNKRDIVSDGILEHQSYMNSKYKILWLVKEPHGKGGWDYADDYVSFFKFQESFPISHRFWANITYVNFGILNSFLPYDNIFNLDEDVTVFNHLKSCALINLKKTTGTSRSDYNSIKQHYEKHKEFINKQIEFIRPDIIICGGTFSIIRHSTLDKDAFPLCDEWGFISNNRLYIDANHPSYFRIDHENYYNQIINCCKQWFNK